MCFRIPGTGISTNVHICRLLYSHLNLQNTELNPKLYKKIIHDQHDHSGTILRVHSYLMKLFSSLLGEERGIQEEIHCKSFSVAG